MDGVMGAQTWKERLDGEMDPTLAREIEIFETQMELRKAGKLDEKIFAETRLRRGVYGQRYDNGQRHDGVETRQLDFPCGDLTKGPETVWDAPGMSRIKIPMGRLTAAQLDVLCETAEEYSDAILHVTTRQDIQLHFVHIEDTPDLMRRLAAVGITTRDACGNSIRNVCACPYSGACKTEAFDVTPYAHALTWHLLGHRDSQDFGRKFKIAFSGCAHEACGLANFHDIGLIAKTQVVEGQLRRGFAFYVGGGLGAVPRSAELLSEFVPEDELMPLSQAVCRVFARHGEKANRQRARLKFLVKQVGIDEFRSMVYDERARIPEEERWTAYLDELHETDERPLREGGPLDKPLTSEMEHWRRTNVRQQPQPGYVVATVRLPLGDFTSDQGRALADLAREYTGDTIRLTVEQNIAFRWLPERDIPAFYNALKKLGLHSAGAGTISDITACPGTDTCKLGISASRGLAGVLEERLAKKHQSLDEGVKGLRIKTSGCFNSCGQHHVADVGFLGVSRNVKGRRVAHFQLVVGGEWKNNGGSYGMAIGAFPSKRVPEVVDRLTEYWVADREDGERFQDFINRVGKRAVKETLDDLKEVPDYAVDPSFYTDWGDAREYTIGDMGVGECAGEVVSFTEFGLAKAERENFEAQLYLDTGDAHKAAATAYAAMVSAARSLVQIYNVDVPESPDDVVGEFRSRLHETKLFHDKYAGSKFAHYFFKAHSTPPPADITREDAHHRIEEAQLFIEAAHACYERIQGTATPIA